MGDRFDRGGPLPALPLLLWLDARDQSLFRRWSLTPTASRAIRTTWLAITHLGGATFAAASVLVPLVFARAHRAEILGTGLGLAVAFLLSQLAKRMIVRERPSVRLAHAGCIDDPDQFSFPSGHSAAAMAVALGYALIVPALAGPLVGLALLVGVSRVALGVHYPGDVLAGTLLAVLAVTIVGIVL